MLAVKHNLVDKRMDESVIENLSTAIVVLDRDLRSFSPIRQRKPFNGVRPQNARRTGHENN